MKTLSKFGLAILSILPASSLVAQDKAPKPPEHFYHLVFQIEETDNAGNVINSRSYAGAAVTENSRGWAIKTGTKIPLVTAGKGEKSEIQYIDVGVNIEFQDAVEEGSKLHLVVNASISSLAAAPDTATADPIIRQNTWSSEVLIPVGKPTVIFSSDNLESKGRTQVELTATRIE
jgi:hypothetical protein